MSLARYGIGSGRVARRVWKMRALLTIRKSPNSTRSTSPGTAKASSALGIASTMPTSPTEPPLAGRQRALAPVLERAHDHGRDRGGDRDPLREHLAGADGGQDRDRDRAAADAEEAGHEAALEPEVEAAATSVESRRAAASSLPAPKPERDGPAGLPKMRLRIAIAIRSPRSEVRALTRAPITAPAEAASDEDQRSPAGSNAPPGASA